MSSDGGDIGGAAAKMLAMMKSGNHSLRNELAAEGVSYTRLSSALAAADLSSLTSVRHFCIGGTCGRGPYGNTPRQVRCQTRRSG